MRVFFSPYIYCVRVSAAAADEVIIMTTRADTMKYKQLLTCPTVAILVHDFPHRKSDVDSEGGKTYSITLHGMAKCVQSAMLRVFRPSMCREKQVLTDPF
jgi:hypothetical protein